MRRLVLGSVALILGVGFAGCDSGGDTTVPFKETNTDQFKDMKEQMIKGMQTKSYLKKAPVEAGKGAETAAPAEKKE